MDEREYVEITTADGDLPDLITRSHEAHAARAFYPIDMMYAAYWHAGYERGVSCVLITYQRRYPAAPLPIPEPQAKGRGPHDLKIKPRNG